LSLSVLGGISLGHSWKPRTAMQLPVRHDPSFGPRPEKRISEITAEA